MKSAWASENPKIVSIDPDSGEAVAHSVGKTTIHYNSTIKTYTQVTVVKTTSIAVDTKDITFITNVLNSNTGKPNSYKYVL